MGKFSAEGKFYIHLIIISFGLLVFTILKNFNFDDYSTSPDLTSTQIKFIYIFLFVGIIGIFLLFVRGFFIKTPHYYTRAGVAMVFIVIGITIIIGMLIHDELLGNEQQIGHLEMLGLLFGSFLLVMGSYTYISIKFPDETIMKYFKQAVKEEIRKRSAEERRWQLQQQKWRRQQHILKRAKMAKAKAKAKKKKKKFKTRVPEVAMSPLEGISVVKCSKCQRSLKITSSERPLTIKCPYCEAIGVIKE